MSDPHRRDLRPMQIIGRLGSGEGMPVEAIRFATANRATVAPRLVEAIARHEANGEVEENGLFMAFHLLGQWREKSAYRELARFLRWPEVESILGDATTETCHKIMANVFDGDPEPIHEIIHDAEADEFVRGRMFDTLVMLVQQGELDRTQVAGFLRSAFDDLRPQDQFAVWSGWQGAVATLALEELAPLVRDAFRRGLIDEMDLSLESFEDDLQEARAGRPAPEWRRKELEAFGDVVEELSHWAGFRPKEEQDDEDDWLPSWSAAPARNPFRDVGRNDPCPCGSGNKFKKCCLGKPEAELQMVAPADDPMPPHRRSGDAGTTVRTYDPFVQPAPEKWLATDEQVRIDMIERYHRRHGFEADRLDAHAAIHAAVENQIAEGDHLPVRRTLLRLMDQGLDRHDAIHAIGSVLVGHIHERLSDAVPLSDRDDNAAYFSELKRLTAKDWLNSG